MKICAIAALAACAAVASADLLLFEANITGAQEVPPTPTTATGTMTGVLDTDAGTFSFEWIITGDLIGEPSAPGAHIHTGFLGENGSIVFPMFTGPWPLEGSSVWSGLSDEQEQRLIDGGYYINFHTTAFPAGELRGQILLVPTPGGAALLAAGALTILRRRR